MSNELPGYDQWKTTPPPEPYCDDDPLCTCTSERMDEWCEVHGRDPEAEYEKLPSVSSLLDWEAELARREAEFEE